MFTKISWAGINILRTEGELGEPIQTVLSNSVNNCVNINSGYISKLGSYDFPNDYRKDNELVEVQFKIEAYPSKSGSHRDFDQIYKVFFTCTPQTFSVSRFFDKMLSLKGEPNQSSIDLFNKASLDKYCLDGLTNSPATNNLTQIMDKLEFDMRIYREFDKSENPMEKFNVLLACGTY